MTDEQIAAGTGSSANPNERVLLPQKRLGRLPLKTTRKALQFSDFFKFVKLPKATKYWTRKKPLDQRTFGNDRWGNCTIAKQAYAATRMERLEQKRTIEISDEEVIRAYRAMILRVYESDADEGAYEDDALSNWRNPEFTFHDIDDHPFTIDAYLRINAQNHEELRAGLALSGAKGIAVCFNLPLAFSEAHSWTLDADQQLTGEWMPGSWGGHSMWAIDYDKDGMTLDDTWGEGPRFANWNAVAAYLDEAHLVIDSVNAWRKAAPDRKTKAALGNVVDAVNNVSSLSIRL